MLSRRSEFRVVPHRFSATNPSGTLPRFLFYSHDGVGLGHTRRNLVIVSALLKVCPEASVLLATGTDEVHRLGVPDNVGVLKLPGLRKVSNDIYEGRHLHIPVREVLALRSSLLKAAVRSFRPDVLVADKHPLGVKGELRSALRQHRSAGGKSAVGFRDILDEPAAVLSEWARHDLQSKIAANFDRLLIYGQRSVFDHIKQYDFPSELAARARFCGYVVGGEDRKENDEKLLAPLQGVPRDRPLVLATPGGGEDGFALLHTFIRAAVGASWHGVVITGPMARGEDHLTLQRLASENRVSYFTFVSGLPGWFDFADALVCMGGYNTLIEAVSRGTPAVCVPRISPRTEQLIRARSFARLGLLQMIEPAGLNVERLQNEITDALRKSRQELLARARATIQCEGARQAAGHLIELAEERRKTTELPHRLAAS